MGRLMFYAILVSQSVIKQILLSSYCYSLYGRVLWDLNNRCVDSVCAAWRIVGHSPPLGHPPPDRCDRYH